MVALVTGAAGFIGGHLVERLAAAGHRVRGLVRSHAQADTIRSLGGEPVFGDVTEPASLRAAVVGASVVFHLAARVSDWGRWPAFAAVGVGGTENALRAAAAAGVARCVHVSSAAVYDCRAADRLRVVPESAPVARAGDYLLGHYARAKAVAERAAWDAHRRGLVAVTVLRPAFVYGPRDRSVLPRLLEFFTARSGCWVGRDVVQDPTYVTDVADCAIAAATHPAAAGRTYNVAPVEEVRLRRFVGLLCEAVGARPPRWAVPRALADAAAAAVETAARVAGWREPPLLTRAAVALVSTDRHYTPDRAVRELGWRPAVGVAEGVARTAAWLRADPELSRLLPGR